MSMSGNECTGPITLRPERPEDEAFLYSVYASARGEELDRTGWDQSTREAFLRSQFAAMRKGYATAFPQAQFAIILVDHQPAGRLVVNRAEHEIRIVDMALLPAHRNRGVGTAIMKGLFAETAKAGKRLRLRVLKHSAAVRLYQRLGFRPLEDEEVYYHMEWSQTSP